MIGFEFLRTVTTRRFWVATLSIPVAVAILGALIFVSNETTRSTADALEDSRFSFAYTDLSGRVPPELAAAYGGRATSDAAQAVVDVRAGVLAAYIAYPEDPLTQPIVVHGQDLGVFENERYAAVARQLLADAAQQAIGDPELTRLAQGSVAVTTRTYEAGRASGGLDAAVLPLLFLVAFYAGILVLGNQMLNSTLEEKENRVTEMILTTLDPSTLIVGKIVSIFLVGLVQLATFALPVVLGYLVFRADLSLPDLDLSSLVVEPRPLLVGGLLLLGGFALFTGSLVAIGAVVPTVKEAGTYFAPLMIIIFIPLYVVPTIVSDPHSPAVTALTYFPYTAPVTALLRNGFGSLGPAEAAVVIAELLVLGLVTLRLAVHLFRYGSIEYSRRLRIREALRRSGTQ
ncbi:MAG TPA: ABC transporter permease [Actinotalea sp.]|nr:ABC transporter permease [Actinotalea sp.]